MENETNPEPRKSLLLFIPSLTHSAGMERASTTVANALTRRGYRVAFAVLGTDTGSFFPLAEGVRVYGLGNTDGVRHHRWRTARRLRRLAVRLGVDYVVNVDVSMVQVSVLALPLPRGVQLLTWEHFSMASVRGSLPARAQRWLAAAVSRRTLVLTEADRRVYPAALRSRVTVIPNFTTLNSGGVRSPLEAPTVVAVGRKVPVKGFDLLIEAWSRVAADFGDWRLRIIGGGNDAGLQRLIDLAGLQGSVSLLPPTPHIDEEYRRASLFVLSSRFESFGLVLIEAKSFGLPVVSFDCPYGPREIVRDGTDGLLVPPGDVAALAAALRRCLTDGNLRRRYGTAAYDDYCARWSERSVVDRWTALLG